jgi:hypothetical protein
MAEHRFGNSEEAPSRSTQVETAEGRIAKPATPVVVGAEPVPERSGTVPSIETLPGRVSAATVADENRKYWPCGFPDADNQKNTQ